MSFEHGQPVIAGIVDIVPVAGDVTLFHGRALRGGREVEVRVLDGDPQPDDHARMAALQVLSVHPHIVTVHAVGRVVSGQVYVVSSLPEQGSLQQVRARAGRLPTPATLDIGVKLAGALESANRAGLGPGSLALEDIVLDADGQPQVAGLEGRTIRPTTTDGQSPEGDDVAGLAAILLALLTGSVRDADSAAAMQRCDVPHEVRAVVLDALGDPDQRRSGSCAEFGEALQAAQEALGLTPSRMLVIDPPPPRAPVQRRRTRARRSVSSMAVLNTLLVLALVSVAWLVAGGSHRTTSPTPAPTSAPTILPLLAEAAAESPRLVTLLEGLIPVAPQPLPPYAEYRTVVDDLAVLAADLPREWTTVDGRPGGDGHGRTIANLRASPDLAKLGQDWAVPGITINATTQLGSGASEVMLLDAVVPELSARCRYDGRRPYPIAGIPAQLDVFASCGGTGTATVVLGAFIPEQALAFRIQLVAPAARDLEVGDRALRSVQVWAGL